MFASGVSEYAGQAIGMILAGKACMCSLSEEDKGVGVLRSLAAQASVAVGPK